MLCGKRHAPVALPQGKDRGAAHWKVGGWTSELVSTWLDFDSRFVWSQYRVGYQLTIEGSRLGQQAVVENEGVKTHEWMDWEKSEEILRHYVNELMTWLKGRDTAADSDFVLRDWIGYSSLGRPLPEQVIWMDDWIGAWSGERTDWAVAYPGILFGGVRQIQLGTKAERTGIWGR